MGYYITEKKPHEKTDRVFYDFLYATDEEVEIAKVVYYTECGDYLLDIEKSVPPELGYAIYSKYFVYYIKVVHDWMNTSLFGNIFGSKYRPSELEDAVRNISMEYDLKSAPNDYTSGKRQKQIYYFSEIPDSKVLDIRKKYGEITELPESDDLIPIGTNAYTIIDYEKILPVVVIDRKGFLYYCKESDAHLHYIPYHQLFRTEEEAKNRIMERNTRRDKAIEKYHLLDHSEDDKVNQDRQSALEWLYYNQDPPELLIEELTQYVVDRK